jgi:hypothetical protein
MTKAKKILEEKELEKKGKLPPKVRKSAAGRPKRLIDWEYVDDLLLAGCSGIQIAAHIGIGFDKLYDKCAEDKGMLFTDYAREKRMKGDSLLKKTQFDLALKKDRTMLVWLGKQRLGQLDRPQFKSEVPHQLLEFIHLLKDSAISHAETQNSLLDDDIAPYPVEEDQGYEQDCLKEEKDKYKGDW